MNISFENPDKINGLLTVTVEETDYKDNVEKTLKDYRKKANVPGFRPGMVPLGLIRRQYGESVKAEEINKVVGEQLYKYIQDNKIQMLGDPLPAEGWQPQDLKNPAPYTFKFDIAVAPEFKCELTGRDKVDYYTIKVDDKMVDDQVSAYASQMGKYQQAETYQDGDSLKGDLRELDENGNSKEGGITVEGAVMLPSYIKVEDQKKLFENAKPGDIITFNPRKAYPDNDYEVSSLLKINKDDLKDHEGDFSYQITEVNHFEKHAIDQELFDVVFGKGTCKDEKEFRDKVVEMLKGQLAANSDYKFLQDVRAHCEKKVGKLTYPDKLLKRIMLANNKDKGEDFVEKNYEGSVKELTWHLIKEQLVAANKIKVEDADIKALAKQMAREQFAQYGMSNVPDEYVENYANDLLKRRESVDTLVNRAIDEKLTIALKGVVKLNEKEVTLDEFKELVNK